MSFVVAIPARYGSTRLAGKPLLDIGGKPMIQRVYEQASAAGASMVVVATDDDRIVQACSDFGAQCVLTSSAHQSGTLRIAEVAETLAWTDEQIVVNVQGDEPLIAPDIIKQVADLLVRSPEASMATLMTPISKAEELFNPNVVKVVCDARGIANYFSRAPMPWCRDHYSYEPKNQTVMPISNAFRHIGIYAYRGAFLRKFGQLTPAPNELLESLEQLRAIYHGYLIAVEQSCQLPGQGVDTFADLEAVRNHFAAT